MDYIINYLQNNTGSAVWCHGYLAACRIQKQSTQGQQVYLGRKNHQQSIALHHRKQTSSKSKWQNQTTANAAKVLTDVGDSCIGNAVFSYHHK